MVESYVVIEGLTLAQRTNGDVQIVIHLEDLTKSLSLLTARENKTFVAVAGKRATISERGHTHLKPRALQRTCEPKTEIA